MIQLYIVLLAKLTIRMKLALRLALLLLPIVTSSSIRAVQVFCVGSTTECSSADNSPCHSLQYYVNNSNFTSNSIFHFLQGQHHLETVITIRNVVNLTLVGASSGVKILCHSPQSGLTVEEFHLLTIENLTFSECSHKPNVSAVILNTGSELRLNHVTISKSSSDSEYTGLSVNNVTGSFSIRSSVLYTPMGNGIQVLYPLSKRHSYFEFSENKVYSASMHESTWLSVGTPNVHIVLTNSFFNATLLVDFTETTNNTIKINSCSFKGVAIDVNIYNARNGCQCNLITELSKVTGYFSFTSTTKNCVTLIEDSNIAPVYFNSYFNSVASQFRNTIIVAKGARTTIDKSNVTFMNCTFKGAGATISESNVTFMNCTFRDNTESAISSFSTNLIFQGYNIFHTNSAAIGGALKLAYSSIVHLLPHTTLLFKDNHADYVGGAIYYNESGHQDQCFYNNNHLSPLTVKMVFINNTASYGGSSLYGGGLEQCRTYDQVINVTNTEEDPSAVAGETSDVCLCDQDKLQPSCSVDKNHHNIAHVFPGQDFSIRLATVTYFTKGNAPGVVPGAIRAYSTSDFPLKASQVSQASNKPYCQNFTFSLNTTKKILTFYLTTEQRYIISLAFAGNNKFFNDIYTTLSIEVNLEECPLGFNLSSISGECKCDHILAHQRIECDINNQSFLVPENSWIGFINKTQSTNMTGTGVIFHPNCPFGYCLPHNVSITSSTGDDQCEPHRTGLLCGKCQEGYSLTLDSGKCAKCSNVFLLLIIPVAVSGLFLVGVLFALNLTVTEGSINGLLFYANVLTMSRVALFLKETSYLYTFLAWLNLDLGIGTCLFDGMDGYTATWLQFVFPVYLWMIILAIILFYRRFPSLAHRLGQENAVKVLATLLLLSYTKLQRTVVTIMSFTTLEYPSGEVRYVWLYDANVEFFKGKHLYLGIAGILVLVFLIVPYTLCLAFFQQLQACSGHRLFQWVNRLKPLFDSYAGPYKDKYRFWTGMLLVVRTILIVAFTINIAGSIEFDLLVILVVSSVLAWAHSNAICKKSPHNYLEAYFYLQLVISAASMLYAKCSNGNTVAIAYMSIGMSLVVFLAVIGYHIRCRIVSFKIAKNHNGYKDMDSFVHERLAT